jgi:hypothetical protein
MIRAFLSNARARALLPHERFCDPSARLGAGRERLGGARWAPTLGGCKRATRRNKAGRLLHVGEDRR